MSWSIILESEHKLQDWQVENQENLGQHGSTSPFATNKLSFLGWEYIAQQNGTTHACIFEKVHNVDDGNLMELGTLRFAALLDSLRGGSGRTACISHLTLIFCSSHGFRLQRRGSISMTVKHV
jgi:hypothetical protein